MIAQALVFLAECVAHRSQMSFEHSKNLPRGVSVDRVRPNPSLERTSTGLALGPRSFSVSSSASRPKRQPGGVRSAQTLGRTEYPDASIQMLRQPPAAFAQLARSECRISEPALLVGFHKARSVNPSMSWPESVDEALCHGWIDGVRKRIDEHSYSIRFTPSMTTSIWSALQHRNDGEATSRRSVDRGRCSKPSHIAKNTSGRSTPTNRRPPRNSRPTSFGECKLNPEAWAFFQFTPPSYKRVMLHCVWPEPRRRRPERQDSQACF